MAKTNRKVTLPVYRLQPKSSLCQSKVEGAKTPRHAIIAIYMEPEIAVQIHTAGTDRLWSIAAGDAAKNHRLIRGMSPADALTLGVWYGEAKSRSLYQELAVLQSGGADAGAGVAHV